MSNFKVTSPGSFRLLAIHSIYLYFLISLEPSSWLFSSSDFFISIFHPAIHATPNKNKNSTLRSTVSLKVILSKLASSQWFPWTFFPSFHGDVWGTFPPSWSKKSRSIDLRNVETLRGCQATLVKFSVINLGTQIDLILYTETDLHILSIFQPSSFRGP